METARHPRFSTYAKVKCQKYGSALDSTMILNNISKSGARLDSTTLSTDFIKGDILRLEIDLEGIQRIRVVNAEVIWSKDGAIGVSFVQPENVYEKLLTR